MIILGFEFSQSTLELRGLKTSQVVLFDTSNGPHLANLCSSADNLDSNVRLWFDNGILVVGELRWCRIGIPLDVVRDQMSRHKKLQRSRMSEETLGVYRVDDSINRLAFERPPHHSAISDSEFSHTETREDSTFRDFESIHDGDDKVAASACAFDILQELACHELVHVATHERRVQSDLTFQVIKEKHDEMDSEEAKMLIGSE
jgi:hypothetical protein